MKITQSTTRSIKNLTLVGLGLGVLLLLLTSCPPSSSIKVKGKITPEPIVGEIVTLKIEALSKQFSGDGAIWIMPSDSVNIVSGNSEWHGPISAGVPFTHEVSICVFQPGFAAIYIVASVNGIDAEEIQLNYYSTATSAELDPQWLYRQPPMGSTPIPTPEPVSVSPECIGDN